MKVWRRGVLVELLPEGDYTDPVSGAEFHLGPDMSWHRGPGYVMTGWPDFYERLEFKADVKVGKHRADH